MTTGSLLILCTTFVAVTTIAANQMDKWKLFGKVIDKADEHIKEYKDRHGDDPPKGGGSSGMSV